MFAHASKLVACRDSHMYKNLRPSRLLSNKISFLPGLHYNLLMALRIHPCPSFTHVAQRRRIPALLLLRRLLRLAVTIRPTAIAISTVAVRAPAPIALAIENDDGLAVVMGTARGTGLSRRPAAAEGGELGADCLAGSAEEREQCGQACAHNADFSFHCDPGRGGHDGPCCRSDTTS